jgi:predicted amidohydrolase YtcJ
MPLEERLPEHGSDPASALALVNGKVWTGNRRTPWVEAVVSRGGRILAAGANTDIRSWTGAGAEVIDLEGRLAVPGFNDAHVHFMTGGMHLGSVKLRDARSRAELRDRVREFASTLPPGDWITGGDWDHEAWEPPALPDKSLIDAVTPHNPAFLNRLDGHMAVANSLAIKAAGISRDTPEPPGGEIVRDAGGEPTGILKDAAMELVYRVIPPPHPERILEALRAAMRYAAENGVTSIQDVSASPDVLAAYQKLLAAGELTVRVYGFQPLPKWQRLAAVGLCAGFGSDRLKIGGVKGFADGSLGSGTALFFEPYLDAPGIKGLPSEEMIPETQMLDNIVAADRAGLQVSVHAIGDRANHIVLNMFREAADRNGARDRRFRIEHAQHLQPADIPRFAELGVIASVQPYHAIDDGRWADRRIGPERARTSYAFRALLDSGAVLACGSDWHVAPMDPLIGIYAAATRATLDGKRPGGWVPEQRITVEEALRGYTLGGAYASFDEQVKGSIEPGKLADFAVLSLDILEAPPADIAHARVDLTVFDGRVVFRRER